MPTPTLDQIRAAVGEKIFRLDSALAVHTYERYTKAASDLVAMYKSEESAADGPRLFGLHIRNLTTRQIFIDTGRWSIYHGWRLRVFLSLDDSDESEKIFDNKIEQIRVAFRDDPDLGQLIMDCTEPNGNVDGIQKLASQPVMFAGVLCHSADLGLTTQHLEP